MLCDYYFCWTIADSSIYIVTKILIGQEINLNYLFKKDKLNR